MFFPLVKHLPHWAVGSDYAWRREILVTGPVFGKLKSRLMGYQLIRYRRCRHEPTPAWRWNRVGNVRDSEQVTARLCRNLKAETREIKQILISNHHCLFHFKTPYLLCSPSSLMTVSHHVSSLAASSTSPIHHHFQPDLYQLLVRVPAWVYREWIWNRRQWTHCDPTRAWPDPSIILRFPPQPWFIRSRPDTCGGTPLKAGSLLQWRWRWDHMYQTWVVNPLVARHFEEM